MQLNINFEPEGCAWVCFYKLSAQSDVFFTIFYFDGRYF